MIFQSEKRRAIPLSICLAVLCAAAHAQNTIPQTDPAKAYSTIGVAPGEILRLDVANIGGTDGVPPGPCNVQLGFVNAAGVPIKSLNTAVPAGQAVFLTLTFAEGWASKTAVDSRTRLNIRPVLGTSAIPPGPCRTVSSAEVFDAILGRTQLYAVPVEIPPGPSTLPPGPPIFGFAAIKPQDSLRLNVTNITVPNGHIPDLCVVRMGFVNGPGNTVKMVTATIAPGQTVSVTVDYTEAAAAVTSTNAQARLNLRPLVTELPEPPAASAATGASLVTASAELLNAITGETSLYILPAVQATITPGSVVGSTNGQ